MYISMKAKSSKLYMKYRDCGDRPFPRSGLFLLFLYISAPFSPIAMEAWTEI